METELQLAERFAREFLDSPWSLFKTRLLARVFLAQQARLAEVERERKQTCVMCGGTGEFVNALMRKLVCECCRPATTEREATPPQAAPEPIVLHVKNFGTRDERVELTTEDCRRIVAMAGFSVPEEGGR